MPSECGNSGYDYPFAIRNFDEPEIYEDMASYECDVFLSGKMGKINYMEKYMNIIDNTMLYYYTCCLTNEEAEIEAAYIKSVYDKLKEDMPNYDFSSRMLPIAIDIEESGSDREATNESYDIQSKVKSDRTKAILHLIDKLIENGVIDERGVIIYGDLNRMKCGDHIEWDTLFNGLEERNVNTVKWGTRAIDKTFESGIEYSNSENFAQNLMNDSTNIEYMKNEYGDLYPYLSDIAMQQIHLDQLIYNGTTWPEKYDVSITTKDTIEAIKNGEDISYESGFISRIEDVNEKSLTEKNDVESLQGNLIPNGMVASQNPYIDNGDR